MIVLASGSTTRAALLANAGVAVEIMRPGVDEDAVKESMSAEGAPPRAIADALAELKATRVSVRRPGAFVVGADTTLTCAGLHVDKPASLAEAREQLAFLSGKVHTLITACVVAQDGAPVWRHVEEAELVMRDISAPFLDSYLSRLGDTALTSAGAYHVEGLGAQLFRRITGDWYAVMGLPLLPLLEYLRVRGVLPT